MKLYVDISTKQVTVSRESVEKTEQNGRQKTERGTGRPMWSTQVVVLDDDGGEVIAITTADEKPNVKVGQPVSVSKLEALPWATNGRNGVAFRAQVRRRGMIPADMRVRSAATIQPVAATRSDDHSVQVYRYRLPDKPRFAELEPVARLEMCSLRRPELDSPGCHSGLGWQGR
jgi:hypothetical protein